MNRFTSFFSFLVSLCSAAGNAAENPVLLSSVEPDLFLPALGEGRPAPGKRAKETHPDWKNSQVSHITYLPKNWSPQKKWPVIVELPGNGNFRSRLGDECNGLPDGCKLGYGLSAGKDYIWIAIPFLSSDREIAITWWGKPPEYDPSPTVRYLKSLVPWICQKYSGNPNQVMLAGFSRGALACNYIGLHDNEVASLWKAMFVYSHYDGVRNWTYPNSDRKAALQRLRRLGDRPQLICHEGGGVARTISYLESTGFQGNLTFLKTGFINHNDAWILRPSPAREKARLWLRTSILQ